MHLLAQLLNRAQRVVVLKVVPINGRGFKISVGHALACLDQLFPLATRAVVVSQLGLNLSGARAVFGRCGK